MLDFKKEYKDHDKTRKRKIRENVYTNIERIKGVGQHDNSFKPEHTPLFISLAHFYNNFLVGHAKSYSGITAKIFDQKTAINKGFSTLGRIAVNKLLNRDSDSNERRVIIDVKHMSLKGRKQYYQMVRGKNIPIIFSHGAVNGYSWKHFTGRDEEGDHTLGYFSHMSINLYDEDLREIVDSDGLIGLATHEGRMPGGYAKKEFDEINRLLERNDRNHDAYLRLQRQAYLKLYMGNIFHIIRSLGHKRAWNHICIGSDYDGIMDPFNRYPESDDFNTLLGDVLFFLKHPFDLKVYDQNTPFLLDKSSIKDLMFGLSPREIMEKIAFKNIEDFLSKYFTDEYRLGVRGDGIVVS